MTLRGRAVGVALAVALEVGVGCGPVSSGPAGSAVIAPMNACEQYACANYVQAGASPTCSRDGQCLVAATYTGLVLVVSLSEDSYYAPGLTFAIPYEHLFDPAPTATCGFQSPPTCVVLPKLGIVQGAYLASPSTQQILDWDLGNPGVPTALPVHVTYRPLWPPGGPASTAVDAESLGLPLSPIDAYVVEDTSGSAPPGPGQGTSLGFQANLQTALYRATITPDTPFDAAFPPDVNTTTIAAGRQSDEDPVAYDVTTEEQAGSPIVPTFDLARAGGLSLVGWSAYLRDATSLERISSLRTLGKDTSAVLLPTNHHPATLDALTNAQLVVAPPAGATFPSYVVTPLGNSLPEAEPVPALPPAVTVTGSVTEADGVTPVEADLVFESIAGASTTQGIYISGPPLTLNTSNFEYTAQTTTFSDAAGGPSSYSIDLPPGQYQLIVRPLDTSHAVTVQTALLFAPSVTPLVQNVVANAPSSVRGLAALADGRPLAGAFVQVLATRCAQGTSTACMPRSSQTTTAADGSYALSLDPGGYTLSIQPADGTRFPWVTQSLLVGPTDVAVPPVTVPAPVYAGLTLHDPYDNPIVSSIVRVFQVPGAGAAVEMGRAITDATGQYDMYLAPSGQ